MHLPIHYEFELRRFYVSKNRNGISGNNRIVDHMRQRYSPGYQNIQNKERTRFEYHLSYYSDVRDYSAYGLLRLYPGYGVHFRERIVPSVRRYPDRTLEKVLLQWSVHRN